MNIQLKALLVCLSLIAQFGYASASKYNVLFILSDNQSYYEMGCHGHADLKTPHMDRLSEEGIDFQTFYAPNYCSPSRSVSMTGKYAIRAGVFDTIGGRSIMHKDQQTIADIMKKHGYATSAYGKWHLGITYPHRPQDRGFDEVYILNGGSIGQLEDYYGNSHLDTTFLHNGKVVFNEGYSTDILFDQAMDWMAKKQDERQPFFCFLSTAVAHGPFQGPDGAKGPAGLTGMIENLDMNIGRMLDYLQERGLDENTVVVFTSDQGMFDRGAPHLGKKKENSQDAKQHVPFMVRMPGMKQGGVNQNLTGMIDFVPTVLDLCGIPAPDDLDGISLKPLLTGNESEFPADRTLIIQCPRSREAVKGRSFSVKTQRWRMEGRKLFDKKADPRLRTDVSKDYPEVMQMLTAKYDAFWDSMPDPATTLSRHEIGDPACPEVILTGMDWYTGAKPWSSGHYKKVKETGGNGAWAVTIVKDGTYTFEVCYYPREAEMPIDATKAKIQIGDVIQEQQIDKSAESAVFTLDLKAGDYDLQTWLSDAGVGEFGALYVYVTGAL